MATVITTKAIRDPKAVLQAALLPDCACASVPVAAGPEEATNPLVPAGELGAVVLGVEAALELEGVVEAMPETLQID